MLVHVESIVAGGGHHDDAAETRVVDGVLQRLDKVLEPFDGKQRPETHVDHVGAHVGRVHDAGDDVREAAHSVV